MAYPEFLQAKEFEKSCRYAIDEQTNSVIANERDLAEANIAVIREQTSALIENQRELAEANIAVLHEQTTLLAEINSTLGQGLGEINGTLNWGFTGVIAGIGRVNDQLADLRKIASTPTQTWAYEQFDIAREMFRKHLYPESLKYLDRAMNGAAGQPGYDVDFRFHYLIGLIRLGDYRNNDLSIINLREAEDAFLRAAKYSATDCPQDSARSWLMAGRATYCSRELKRALQHTKESLSVAPSPIAEAFFQRAKILCAMGDQIDVAAEDVMSAVKLDRLYGLKIACDGDLIMFKDIIMRRIEEEGRKLRGELAETDRAITTSLGNYRSASLHGVVFADSERNVIIEALGMLADAKDKMNTATYFGLIDAFPLYQKVSELIYISSLRYHAAVKAAIQAHRDVAMVAMAARHDAAMAGIHADRDKINARMSRASAAVGWYGLGFGLLGVFGGIGICLALIDSHMSTDALIEILIGVIALSTASGLLVGPWRRSLVGKDLARVRDSELNETKQWLTLKDNEARMWVTIAEEEEAKEKQARNDRIVVSRIAPMRATNTSITEPEVGCIYDGKVTGITKFGCFVEILPGCDGLVHMSEMVDLLYRKDGKVEDVCKVGDQMWVKSIAVDEKGRVKLSQRL